MLHHNPARQIRCAVSRLTGETFRQVLMKAVHILEFKIKISATLVSQPKKKRKNFKLRVRTIQESRDCSPLMKLITLDEKTSKT